MPELPEVEVTRRALSPALEGNRFPRTVPPLSALGEACPKCGAVIHRIVQNGRSTFFCPRCQK